MFDFARTVSRLVRPAIAASIALLLAGPALAGGTGSFVNWESPHVHPIDLTPDSNRLLVVNTADNRLEVFAVTAEGLARVGSIPVGLDPVSVRAFDDQIAWVVNQISDSVSIVDLTTMNTRITLPSGDEPADVVFAGALRRAFVSVSQENRIDVYDPANLSTPPIAIDIEGEDPRALATDGTNVYAAIFESGNLTTVLNESFHVSNPALNPYPGTPNPPPNAGDGFDPPIAPDLPDPTPVGHIVKRDADGFWRDDNGGDWSSSVIWDLHDHDTAVIDVATLDVTYVRNAMNLNMHLDVAPNGLVAVVGTEATNERRFEPNINGTFVRSIVAAFTADSFFADIVLDLNPHLTYDTPTIPQEQRDLSIGDPRAIKWSTTGDRVYIAGMGSNNVLVLGSTGVRIGLVEVGAGPTGLAVDDERGRVYAINKFDGTISIIDSVGLGESARVGFYDPTPQDIKLGRPHLYDTHKTSGLGQVSCGSCHIDGRMDHLAWDLGDPTGPMKTFNQECTGGSENCVDWHPMKGPMTTQTLVGIIGTEPFHWRGDRDDLAEFNAAFEGLLGDDEQLTDEEMAEFEAFVATLTFPPNPFRNLDGSLSSLVENGGNAITGAILFSTGGGGDPLTETGMEAGLAFGHPMLSMSGGGFNCIGCHALPTGTDATILEPLRAGGITQNAKTAQLRNQYDKAGADFFSTSADRGFGMIHDGSFLTHNFFLNFFFNMTEQQALDVEAFLLSLAVDTQPAVGVQTTIGPGGPGPGQAALLEQLLTLANDGAIGIVAKGVRDDLQRGYAYRPPNIFQSDRALEQLTPDELFDVQRVREEITVTAVPLGSETRIGVDRDEDGYFDRDEIDAGSDPADPNSVPNLCPADLDGSGEVDFGDILEILVAWGESGVPQDLDGSGEVDFGDILVVLTTWGPCPLAQVLRS